MSFTVGGGAWGAEWNETYVPNIPVNPQLEKTILLESLNDGSLALIRELVAALPSVLDTRQSARLTFRRFRETGPTTQFRAASDRNRSRRRPPR